MFVQPLLRTARASALALSQIASTRAQHQHAESLHQTALVQCLHQPATPTAHSACCKCRHKSGRPDFWLLSCSRLLTGVLHPFMLSPHKSQPSFTWIPVSCLHPCVTPQSPDTPICLPRGKRVADVAGVATGLLHAKENGRALLDSSSRAHIVVSCLGGANQVSARPK